MVDEWTDPLNWSATQGNADPTPLSLRRGGPLLESASIASLSDRRNGGQSPRPRHGRPPPRRGYFMAHHLWSPNHPPDQPASFGCRIRACLWTFPNHIFAGSNVANVRCEIPMAGSPWSLSIGCRLGDPRSARWAKRPMIDWYFRAHWHRRPSPSSSKIRDCSSFRATESPPPSTASRFPPTNRWNCAMTERDQDRYFVSDGCTSPMFIASIAPHSEYEIEKPRV